MVFSSLFFVYFFLPLNLLAYTKAKTIHTKNIIMLIFSLCFYAWGEPKYLLLLVGMSFADWLFALAVERTRGTFMAKLWLFGASAVSLGLLIVFKYGTFFLSGIKSLFDVPAVVPEILLPIGISFYTFQLLSYVVDVYRGDVEAEKSFPNLLMYASLFHQCIAGPIVRYQDVAKQIRKRKASLNNIGQGVMRFSIGLAKKALLANSCGALTDKLLLSDSFIASSGVEQSAAVLSARPAAALWLGVAFYMLQIYLDFSAYSDMAIGMGLMTGFRYKENFDYPYISRSVTEFWRRWHISLGTFFRDYVYIPLGGNRKGDKRTLLNLFIVWFLTGFWHGASWNFAIWGLYFFVFLAGEKFLWGKKLKRLPSPVSHLYLVAIVYFGWILFKFRQLKLAGIVFGGMFCLNGNSFTSYESDIMIKSNLFFLAVCIIACVPIAKKVRERLLDLYKRGKIGKKTSGIIQIAYPAILMILSTMALVGNSYNPFLYFQF